MLQFGQKDSRYSYLIRPGVYAIAINQTNIGIIRLPDNYLTLPGGGIDYDESEYQALEREILEETGYNSDIIEKIGQAGQYISIPDKELYLHKICHFYKVSLKEFKQPPTEPDHFFEWLPVEQALHDLFEESQKWAIQQALR